MRVKAQRCGVRLRVDRDPVVIPRDPLMTEEMLNESFVLIVLKERVYEEFDL